MVCFSLGLAAVWIGNNYPNKNTGDTYYPNLTSIHSWIGISAISLYGLNYLLGLVAFGLRIPQEDIRVALIGPHMNLGTILIALTGFAAVTGSLVDK